MVTRSRPRRFQRLDFQEAHIRLGDLLSIDVQEFIGEFLGDFRASDETSV